MRILSKNRRGETLIEVLVAIVMIGLAFAAITRVMGASQNTNSITEHTTVALSLADEGLEAVRQIRDGNWLRYSGMRRTCWNFLSDNDGSGMIDGGDAPCSTAINPRIASGSYLLDISPATYEWFATSSGAGALNINGLLPESAHLFLDTTTGLYRPQISGSGETLSRYYREIFISYPDTGDATTSTQMQAEALVQWLDQGIIHSVRLTTQLTDYLGRSLSL